MNKNNYFVWLWRVPGAGPKCLTASLELLGPESNTQFSPFGELRANWSNVMIWPPFFKILALACSVTCNAQTFKMNFEIMF